ncbi:MAG TPA: right-handed parallel beta-helix repeat-containing protein [Flavobacteriaceae bacterium]|nr:right-handed parallel beta-helix repeat-containing protein [Flavobacteriaceae bacterium]
MRYFTFLFLIFTVVLLGSCRKDFDTVASSGNLKFSKDTVYLDTVFSGIGSSTYNLTVHNTSDEDITIPSIRLAQGENSFYRLNVDGLPGKIFENIDILANDSMYVFVETTASIQDLAANQLQFLYTDAILFDSGSKEQKVELVTLVQDAIFLYPEKFEDGSIECLPVGINEETGEQLCIEGFFLDDAELHFTNEKPYVIYGYAAVGAGKTLTIDSGARIHFHSGSGIIVAQNGSLHVNGELSTDTELMENEVIFEGDRLEPEFSEVPGQWGAIWLTAGSTDHNFNHATIKNATVGILMDSNDGGTASTLTLKNTQIYNSANVGLLARTGNIYGENLVINNSGQASVSISYGGNYSFAHCTFTNYWDNGFRQFPAVLISNAIETPDGIYASDLTANFTNCIIYGNENIELLFDKSEEAAFNFSFKNCLIRFNDFAGNYAEIPEYNFENPALFENSIFNEDPVFLAPNENKMKIGEESAANGIAIPNLVPSDILGVSRSASPDSGAYESVVFPVGD